MVTDGYANDEGDYGKASHLEQRPLEKHLVDAIDTSLDVDDTSLAPLISIPHLSFDSIEPPVYAIDTPVLSHDCVLLCFRHDRCQ